MRSLKETIAKRQSELRSHQLFEVFEDTRTSEPIARMARAIAWWPMVFQDVLRLNVDFIQGSGLERFAEHHRMEDAGHDRWFIQDLRTLSVPDLQLPDLFSSELQTIRDLCYSLVSVVHSDLSPAQRVAFLLALEPTGHVFFEAIVDTVDRVCPELPLLYFAHHHLGVEKAHDLFSESTDADLDQMVLDDAERERCEKTVAYVFETFDRLFSYLVEQMNADRQIPSHIRELGSGAVETRPALRNVRAS